MPQFVWLVQGLVMDPRKVPVIVGVSRITNHDAKSKDLLLTEAYLSRRCPSKELATVSDHALRDAGLVLPSQRRIQYFCAVRSWLERFYVYKCGLAAAAGQHVCGVHAGTVFVDTGVGGNSPLMLLGELCERISRGEAVGVSVVAGMECRALYEKAKAQGAQVPWGGEFEDPIEAASSRVFWGLAQDTGSSDIERANHMSEPRVAYPILEQARRHHLNLSAEENLRNCVKLCARMASVAASSSNSSFSWQQGQRSEEDIATVSREKNRWIAYPVYSKLMCARPAVDMAGAFVVTSLAEAQRLGINPCKYVFVASLAQASEPSALSSRRHLHAPPSLKRVLTQVLKSAGKRSIHEIDHIDLYSCFPVAVKMACDALGISPESRDCTVTGGLAFAGAPHSSYVMHSMAAMVERLRGESERRSSGCGLVSAVGWYMTKNAAAILSREAPMVPFEKVDLQCQLDLENIALPVAQHPHGSGTVLSYTIFDEHAGKKRLVVLGALADGRRFVANSGDRAIIDYFILNDGIGATVIVHSPNPASLETTIVGISPPNRRFAKITFASSYISEVNKANL